MKPITSIETPQRFGLLTLSLTVLAAGGCKNATPAKFDELLAPLGAAQREPICKVENDGKRVLVEGHLMLPDRVKIEDGKLDLDLYAAVKDGEGIGRSVRIEAKDKKHVTFKTSGESFSWGGGRAGTKAKIEAATLHAAGGDGQPGDRFTVALDVEVLKKFNSQEISACVYHLVELKR